MADGCNGVAQGVCEAYDSPDEYNVVTKACSRPDAPDAPCKDKWCLVDRRTCRAGGKGVGNHPLDMKYNGHRVPLEAQLDFSYFVS